jgi:hypothetical protein
VTFTTYALSLSFFEAVILDGLVRGGSRALPLLLSDVHGVRESLSERGAHRVGRDYEVEPVSVPGGVFHPKIAVLVAHDQCHVLVGSGNLTFNGWGGNCEVIEHLHPGFAAGAIASVAEFFERLSTSTRVRFGAGRECAGVAASLRRALQGRPQAGETRFLHNLDLSLTDQIVQAAQELGGAQRLAAAAPFWDQGAALDALCRALGVDEALVHAHAGGRVESNKVGNWPRKARTTVQAVRIEPFDKTSEAGRRLHAKVFEIVCRRGRLLVSGSANGTDAALGRDRNIEACVMRVERKRVKGWKFVGATPPKPAATLPEAEPGEHDGIGLLRAALDGDQVVGQILTPQMSGTVSVYHVTALGHEKLCNAAVDAEGAFGFAAPQLEKESWLGRRLVLRVADKSGRLAEGFVSLASYAVLTRHTGAVTPRILALILGNETPADVAAILDWFLEDPARLRSPIAAIPGRGESQGKDDTDQPIDIAALDLKYIDAIDATNSIEAGGRQWVRLLDHVLSAFREARGRFVSLREQETEDDGASPEAGVNEESIEEDPAIDEAYDSFEQLFQVLTADDAPSRHLEVAFDLTGFICARLNPDIARARAWLLTVIGAWLAAGVRPERRAHVAAAILTVLGSKPDVMQARLARKSLLQLGYDVSSGPPASEPVKNYQAVLVQREPFAALWMRVQQIRTYQEQVKAYLRALESGEPAPDDYPDLPSAVPDAWPALTRALKSRNANGLLLFAGPTDEACPSDHYGLPEHEIDRLRTIGIAIAKHCCGKVVIRREP